MKKNTLSLTALTLLIALAAGCGDQDDKPQQVNEVPTAPQITATYKLPDLLGGHAAAWWCFVKSSSDGKQPFDRPEEFLDFCEEHNLHVDLPLTGWIENILERGLKISCIQPVFADGTAPFKPSLADPQNGEAVMQAYKDAIDLAAKHGIPNILGFTGDKIPGMLPSVQASALADKYKIVVAYGKKKGVRVALECLNDEKFTHPTWGPMQGHPGYFGSNPRLCLAIVKNVNEPGWMGLASDFYHFGVEGYSLTAESDMNLHKLIPEIRDWTIHLHAGGAYDDDNLNRGPLHFEGEKVHYAECWKLLQLPGVTTVFESPIFGPENTKEAATEYVVEGKKLTTLLPSEELSEK